MESPFKMAAQRRMVYSSSDSVSPKSGSTPKSASDYGSYVYSERGKLTRLIGQSLVLGNRGPVVASN